MGLVTTRALLVALRGRRMHIRVAALALFLDASCVRFVTALTVAVALVHFAVLLLVTALAFHLKRFGTMRQATMAIGAVRVPCQRRGVLGVLFVTVGTQRHPLVAEQKVMGLVTLAAADPSM